MLSYGNVADDFKNGAILVHSISDLYENTQAISLNALDLFNVYIF